MKIDRAPSNVAKVEAHAEHLLDGFRALRARYALLHPMLHSEKVVADRGSGKQWSGFSTLRSSLFLTCAQDIAKFAADKSPRAPSVRNIAAALRDDRLVAFLKARYSAWVTPAIEAETDPEIAEALRLLEIDERAGRAIEFDRQLGELLDLASELEASQVIKSFQTIRDQITAHTDVCFEDDKYVLIAVADLGLQWRHLREVIDTLQRAVELIGVVVRNAGFAWDALDKQLATMADDFWAADVGRQQAN